MKRRIRLVVLVCCILLGGCLGQGQEAPLEFELPSNTPVIKKPTTSVEEAFVTNEVIPEVEEKSNELMEAERLGVTYYVGEDGEVVYEASTCFYDNNGLLCVGIRVTCPKDAENFVVEKTYYLPDERVYRVVEEKQGQPLELFYDKVVQEEYVTTAYEEVTYRTITGHVWTVAGEMVKTSDLLGEDYGNRFVCTGKDGYIPVTEGERYRLNFYFSWFSNVGGVVFLDKDDKVVASCSFNSSTTVKDHIINVPKGAEKMHLSLFAIQPHRIERLTELVGADLKRITEEEYISQSLQIMQSVSRFRTKNYSLDKGYITFVLDDCRSDMNQVADIFEQYDIPLCIAAVNEHLPFGVSGGKETMLEVCERVVANGGELLVHDDEVITEEVMGSYEKMLRHFFVDRWQLEQYGFDVNGIILAGGKGQVAGHTLTDYWSRAFYKYSDLYGEQQFGEPYYHRRIWLGNTSTDYKKVIQSAIDEKKWEILYFHDLNEVSEEELHEIMQYITSLSESDIEVVTYKELYDRVQ